MDKRVKLNKKPLSRVYYYHFNKNNQIIVNFLRFIFPYENPFLITINGKDIYTLVNDGNDESYGEVIYPEWDEYEKYYYFDIKFYKEIRIKSISVNINGHEDNNDEFYIEYDNEYKKLNNPLNDLENDEFPFKEYYMLVFNGENIEDDPIDRELLYVNGHDEFTIEQIGNDLFKLKVDDIKIMTLDWDTSYEEYENGSLYAIISELPIKSFPVQLKNKEFFSRLKEKKSIKNIL